MRLLEQHKATGDACNSGIKITVLDEPGAGGACHDYRFDLPDGDNWILCFQNGPVSEAGANGLTHEALLAVLIDRLEGFQAGEYACEENSIALNNLKFALDALQERTRKRMERGVEGTNEV